MSYLISRKAVLKLIEDIKVDKDIPKNYGTLLDIMSVIRNMPTAYDVDKVVEHLTKRFDFCQEMAEKNDKAKFEEMAFAWRQKADGIMDAIYVVKGAVKE